MMGKVTWAGKTSLEITMELDQVRFILNFYNNDIIVSHFPDELGWLVVLRLNVPVNNFFSHVGTEPSLPG